MILQQKKLLIFLKFNNFHLRDIITAHRTVEDIRKRVFVINERENSRILTFYDFIIFKMSVLLKGSAKVVGFTPEKNVRIRMHKNTPLASREATIELPKDRVIFRTVLRYGTWEIEESEFLAKAIKEISSKSNKVALVDIGANSGLVSLQTSNLSGTNHDIVLFEPLSKHTKAIKHNLSNLNNKFFINEFGLGLEDGIAEFYTQGSNFGNSSLLKTLVPSKNLIKNEIVIKETAQVTESLLNQYESIVLKCDIQGMDSVVLARISENIWEKIVAGVIEVHAHEQIDIRDIEILLKKLTRYNFLAWDSQFTDTITLKDLRDFWLAKNNSEKNLFFKL